MNEVLSDLWLSVVHDPKDNESYDILVRRVASVCSRLFLGWDPHKNRRTMMTDNMLPEVVSERLATLRVEHTLVELVRRVAAERAITADPEGGTYVAVRPNVDSQVACYVNRTFAALQLAPGSAAAVIGRDGWRVDRTNAETQSVHVDSDALANPADLALAFTLFGEALDKSMRGPAARNVGDRRPFGQERPIDTCPKCGLEVPGGHCADCD